MNRSILKRLEAIEKVSKEEWVSIEPTTIRAARRGAGLSQLKLCAKADISIKTLSAAEKWGPRAVNAESLKKIAAALGVSVDAFTELP